MLFFLKLGIRNLLKHYRRTLKTMLTIVIGLGACLLAQGFMSHTLWGLRESLINGGLGHFQIYKKGYNQHNLVNPYRYLVRNYPRVMKDIKKIPSVKLVAPRLTFQGIVSSGEKSVIVLGTAGQPDKEDILNSFSTIKNGSFLKKQKPFGIVVGSGVARKLGTGTGKTVSVTATLKDGGYNVMDMDIIGEINAQAKVYDDVLLYTPLKAAQELLTLPGSVDRLIVLLDNSSKEITAEKEISYYCAQHGLEYKSWRELAGVQYSQPRLFYDLVYYLMMLIIILVVMFAISNTLNLAMHERVREIGTIRSVGTTRLQVVLIFLTESLLIGLIGGAAGLLAGYGVSEILNSLGGVPIPPPPGQARGYIAFFKPEFKHAVQLWLLFTATSTLAGVYPAVRAARLQIVDALRWI